MKIPQSDSLDTIVHMLPLFLSYVLSFVYVGIYWNNHHHMFFAVEKINGKVLWANLHLLFWLSLVPFATGWMGENHFTQWPVVLYGVILLMNAIAYFILTLILMQQAGKGSKLAKAIGKDCKGKASVLLYLVAIGLAFFNTKLSLVIYSAVAVLWFIPDPRIEKLCLTIKRIDNQNLNPSFQR